MALIDHSKRGNARRPHVLMALVENKPGVLTRVASLFRRRGFNIESLTVGHTDTPDISRMTIVVDATRPTQRWCSATCSSWSTSSTCRT